LLLVAQKTAGESCEEQGSGICAGCATLKILRVKAGTDPAGKLQATSLTMSK